MKKFLLLIFCALLSSTFTQPPKLTLIIVVDQLSTQEIKKFKPYLNGGIGFMLKNALSYDYAFMPHAYPETAPGHSTLSTGVTPKDHGIVANRWPNKAGVLVRSDDDGKENAVFDRNGLRNFGKSANTIMVDTLADQLMLNSGSDKKYTVIALSHKSRAAIPCAGKLGKALWFDEDTGMFTSSKAYFNALPAWLESFNSSHNAPSLSSFAWDLVYPINSPAYALANPKSYEFSGSWGLPQKLKPLANTTIVLRGPDKSEDVTAEHPYSIFLKTPLGSQWLIDLAKVCLDEYLKNHDDHVVLWLSLSSLDRIVHPYGPDSLEALDMLYHLDRQLKEIITYAQKKVDRKQLFLVLTSDHGVMPLPELVKEKGYTTARRIYSPHIQQSLNRFIEKRHGIKKVSPLVYDSNVYLDTDQLSQLAADKKEAIITDIQRYLEAQPGIKRAWTLEELEKSSYHLELNELESLYKNQIFRGRSSHIICQTYPYVLMSSNALGTTHISPYRYDTHIPLMLYQKGSFVNKKITTKVWAHQLPVTLAHLLKVPAPSAATLPMLPGISQHV